jgi:hypothetical protein
MKKLIFLALLLPILFACTVTETEAPDSSMMLTDIARMEEESKPPVFKASAIENRDLLFTFEPSGYLEGGEANFRTALAKGEKHFSYNGVSYYYDVMATGTYRIFELMPVAEVMMGDIQILENSLISEEFNLAIQKALEDETEVIEHRGKNYVVSSNRKPIRISALYDAALASTDYLEAYDSYFNEVIFEYEFRLKLEMALSRGEPGFSHEGKNYGIISVPGGYSILDVDQNLFAELSDTFVLSQSENKALPLEFKNMVRDAIESDQENFVYRSSGGYEQEYSIEKIEGSWLISAVE